MVTIIIPMVIMMDCLNIKIHNCMFKKEKNKICIFLVFNLFTTYVYSQDIPFGTIEFTKDVYVDATEVDVGSWLSYYSWVLNHEGYEEAQKILPDSSAVEADLWTFIKKRSNDIINIPGRYSLQPIGYFGKVCKESAKYGKRLSSERRYCALLNFPITGVSYTQVIGFCEWRTKIEGNNKFIFRLPTLEEWKDYAKICLSDLEKKNGFRDSLSNKKCPKYNFNITCSCGNDDYQGKLNGIGLYSPDEKGAYDLFGNVSEMTSLNGIAKGGNFNLHANQCHLDSIQYYTKPQSWLGFRCIAIKTINRFADNQLIALSKEQIDSSFHTQKNKRYGKFIDDRDGKSYKTIIIKNQLWLAENLAFKPDSGEYWSWNNDESYVPKYGYLYTWKTAQNVCPINWHLPSKEEFENLLYNVGNRNLKLAFNEIIESGNSGFELNLDIGTRLGKKNFSTMESALWSSTDKNRFNAWALYYSIYDQVFDLNGNVNKKYGLPVRCIKDK